MTEQAVTYFDDTRKALTFALNFKDGPKVPMMSRMLAQLRSLPRRVSKAQRKRFLQQFEHDADLLEFAKRYLDSASMKRRGSDAAPPTPKGLDGAYLAGLILSHFERLEPHHQTILRGRVCEAYVRCACGSPCCSGWARQLHWAQAVRSTCEWLERVGDVTREGKRGLSSQPAMRLAIVERYYLGSELSLNEIARIGSVSLVTAAKHRDWIVSYLESEEDSAWTDLAAIFDAEGVTGAFA